MHNRPSPWAIGKRDAEAGRNNENPYMEFSEKWADYNRGYNKIANPWASDFREHFNEQGAA